MDASVSRLFAAVPVSDVWLDRLDEYAECLRRTGKFNFLRFHPRKTLHVTLLFIGEVPDREVRVVRDILRYVASTHQPFSLSLDKMQFMQDAKKRSETKKNRRDMLWAAFRPHQEFINLVNLANEELCYVAPVQHLSNRRGLAIKPHITMARFNNDVPFPNRLPSLPASGFEDMQMEVSTIYLEQSCRVGSAKKYALVDTFVLGSP